MTTSVVCVILDGCRKQRIDEGCLSQARFASDLERMLNTRNIKIRKMAAVLTIIVNAAPRFATILCLAMPT